MLSLRQVARSAPRLARFSTPILRTPVALARQSAIAPRLASLRSVNATLASQFSTSRVLASAETEAVEGDAALSAKLESEIEFEEEVTRGEQMPASIKDFLENSPFELIDVPGRDDVKLVRNFGEEKITVSFSIVEMPTQDELPEEDEAFGDEALESEYQSQSQGNPNSRQQALEEEGAEEDESEFEEPALPTPLSIVIEKPGKAPGALNIEATAQDGAIIVDNVYYFADAAQAFASSPEASQSRVDAYPGPAFDSLDEDLQVLLESFLEERGISQTLAVFAPDYIDYKEQKEYVSWLKNVKAFVDA